MLNLVDENGAPAPISLPSSNILKSNLLFTVDGQEVQPFYAAGGGNVSEVVRTRLTLVLVDVSGSMKRKLANGQTRFDAVKSALGTFVDNFRDDSDRVAIVPFESHHVHSTVREAVFSNSKQQALDQISSLPVPENTNNTGLYTAEVVALQVLSDKRAELAKEAPDRRVESTLIVMTDGANEVLRGDDADLLSGAAGLSQSSASVEAARDPVIGIGFGNPADIDVEAMRRLSTKFYMATDMEALRNVFTYARTLTEDRILAAFLSPWSDRASLAGRNVEFRATLKTPDGHRMSSGVTSFQAPQIGLPLFEGKATPAELTSLVETKPEHRFDIGILRPVVVLLGLSLLLFLLWFWVPRLVWPEQYAGSISHSFRPRWASGGRTLYNRTSGGSNCTLPTGFAQPAGGSKGVRNPADPTFVQSRLSPRG